MDALAVPSRRHLISAVLGLPFLAGVEIVEIYRLIYGVGSGMLPISTVANWNVEWQKSALGFSLALAIHTVIIVLVAAFIWAGCLTVRQWFRNNKAHRRPPTNFSNK